MKSTIKRYDPVTREWYNVEFKKNPVINLQDKPIVDLTPEEIDKIFRAQTKI